MEKNFWGPGKFCRLLWDQGFEYVTGTGSWKKTFGAPESFVGFCGTKGSNMWRGQHRGKKLLGPWKVLSAFVGPRVRICDGDRIMEKNFWGPGKFCRLLWDQGFEYVTGTASWKKTFGALESFVGFCGTGGSNMWLGQDRGKKLLGPPKVLWAFAGPGVRIYDGDRAVEKTVRAPKSFFPLLRNQEWQLHRLGRQFQN